MPQFTIRCATADGQIMVERIEAPTERGALALIESTGRTAIEVLAATAKRARAPRQGVTARGRKVRRAVVAFIQQLTAVVESGIPVVAGIRTIAEQTEHAALREALNSIASRVEDGSSLAEALKTAPRFFTPVFSATVAAGEASGTLAEVLDALGRYEELELENRDQIRSALMYPTLVVCALVLAVIIMLVFVVPQFATMFAKFNEQLPLVTRVLLGVSALLRKFWAPILVAALVSPACLRKLFSFSGPGAWLDRTMLRMPVIGRLLQNSYMHRLVELLNLMNRSSLPIVSALRITADSMPNRELKTDVNMLAREVEGGQTLGEAFARTRWLTPLVKRMLSIGEQSGRTDRIFEYLGRYYAVQTQRSIKALSTMVEPALIAGLAAIVLCFSLAIFLPMWRMLKMVGSA